MRKKKKNKNEKNPIRNRKLEEEVLAVWDLLQKGVIPSVFAYVLWWAKQVLFTIRVRIYYGPGQHFFEKISWRGLKKSLKFTCKLDFFLLLSYTFPACVQFERYISSISSSKINFGFLFRD